MPLTTEQGMQPPVTVSSLRNFGRFPANLNNDKNIAVEKVADGLQLTGLQDRWVHALHTASLRMMCYVHLVPVSTINHVPLFPWGAVERGPIG